MRFLSPRGSSYRTVCGRLATYGWEEASRAISEYVTGWEKLVVRTLMRAVIKKEEREKKKKKLLGFDKGKVTSLMFMFCCLRKVIRSRQNFRTALLLVLDILIILP